MLRRWIFIPLVVAGSVIVAIVAIPIPGLGKLYDLDTPDTTLAQAGYFRFFPPPHRISDKLALLDYAQIRMKATPESLLEAVRNNDVVKEFFKQFPKANMQIQDVNSTGYSLARYGYPADLGLKRFDFYYSYGTTPLHSDRTPSLEILVNEYKQVETMSLRCGGAFTSFEEATVEKVRTFCPNPQEQVPSR